MRGIWYACSTHRNAVMHADHVGVLCRSGVRQRTPHLPTTSTGAEAGASLISVACRPLALCKINIAYFYVQRVRIRRQGKKRKSGFCSSLETTAAAKIHIVQQESIDIRCSLLWDSKILKYTLTLTNCNTSRSSALPHRMKYVRLCRNIFQKPEKLLLLYSAGNPGFSRRNILL
ncbi:hypothetical protein IG631_20168 [Alternaria alternata]|nr:hypothetical protein IG631_20168 [Alternaria alternata]